MYLVVENYADKGLSDAAVSLDTEQRLWESSHIVMSCKDKLKGKKVIK